ncbi:MAG: hypothetical protein WC677_07120 [Clostridia bacterium]|jgi:hypothetical protein
MLFIRKISTHLFESDFEKLIIKKAAILFVILTTLTLIIFNSRFYILTGLAVGGLFSLLRLGSLSNVLSGMLFLNNTRKITSKSIVSFIISQLMAAVLLICSALLNIWLFVGITTGILLVPTTIFINAITESFGITHNNFE